MDTEEIGKRKKLFSPGIEPGTFCVLDRCDNRYTTKTGWPVLVRISTPPIHRPHVAPLPAQSDNVESKCQRYRGRCVGVGAVREQQLRSRSFKNPSVVLNLFSSTSSSTKIPAGVGSSTDQPRWSYPLSIRYGLVVRIPGSHPGGPGSIPGNGIIFFTFLVPIKTKLKIDVPSQWIRRVNEHV